MLFSTIHKQCGNAVEAGPLASWHILFNISDFHLYSHFLLSLSLSLSLPLSPTGSYVSNPCSNAGAHHEAATIGS